MNAYKVLRDRQQEEFNSIPLGFAFGQKQFDELLVRWEITADEAPLKISALWRAVIALRSGTSFF